MNQITAQQAEYILNHGAYADDPALLGIGVTDGDGNTSTESGYYLLEIDPQEDPPPFYEAIATAQNEQAKDTRCQEFKITDTGTKTATSDDCW
ncbi:MAG: type IV pilin protein [Gammaproteobacteria bacterium]|nr:type IV pilin protein [Gammaproteobacteria bacterium]